MEEQRQEKTLHQESHVLGQDAFCLRLVLFCDEDKLNELWLPNIPEGTFRFDDEASKRLLSIVAKNGRWVAVCRAPAFWADTPSKQNSEIELIEGQLLTLEAEDGIYRLYVESATKENIVFHNYTVHSDIEINIGNQPKNHIYYNNQYVSHRHAILSRIAGQWKIQDVSNEHGVYVNGEKCHCADLKPGDVVYILGLRIIAGPAVLSISGNSDAVTINHQGLQNPSLHQSFLSRYYGEEDFETQAHYFNRPPRKRINSEAHTIEIEGPPMSMERAKMPLMLRMGSSMVRGGAAALAGNFMTLISSVLFPLLSSKYTENQQREYEQLRTTKYGEYLNQKRKEILDACVQEQQFLNQKHPVLAEVVAQAEKKSRLWERRLIDDDFLCVRLGTGRKPLGTEIEHPTKRFELTVDALEEKMYQLAESSYYVDNAPIVLSLLETTVCGILGSRKHVIDYVAQLLCQLAVFHSYDEVKLVFLVGQEELAQMDYLRYLPHVWDDNRTFRFVATTEAEAYTLGDYLKAQISQEEKEIRKTLKNRPYFVVFALDKKLLDGHEVMKTVMQSEENCGVSIVAAYDELPKETQKIIILDNDQRNTYTSMDANGGEDTNFVLDPCSNDAILRAIHTLSNTRLKALEQTQMLPQMVTFLEMFKVGRIEQLNPIKRWQDNNPATSLATPVGIASDGSVFMLDLHEKHQGPHGLIAGMTGSGKSEFIITYILSMAVNYHPDEVAFVLIDYKGGGLTDAFENPRTGVRLPHLVGTITNLDGASIQRSLMSIESELIRRQKVFSETSKAFDEGSMNIYTYQKLYRAGKVSEPMPHLFIVSDEFAELKQQQPEFMEKLISAARIGRSLGVHLILATQKPSGVVNDQIRSNTKFRVCLRVQDRSDSMDMLKRPEAAELTDTGRFYLQVGYNEYFALGQSAWCGAPYEPQDTVLKKQDDTIEFLDTTGQVITKAKPKLRKVSSGMSQIVATVKYLSDLAKTQNITSRQLWQPELPAQLNLASLSECPDTQCGNMCVPVGLVDDTENQIQFPLRINFEDCQNLLVIGESGSGKTMLLQNILYTLTHQLSPEEFNFYALDYSSRMLKLFNSLPHCGGILLEEETDELDEFFKLINAIIAQRKKLFSELELDNFQAARTVTKLPLILVVIDNAAGLGASKKGEKHMFALQSYMKNSANYGVKFILTCNRTNELSSRIRQELGDRLCLHLTDKFDYNDVLGCRTDYIPPAIPGRGLYNDNGRPLEFQAGIICAASDDKVRVQYVKDEVSALCRKYGTQSSAQRLPVVREDAEYADFAAQFRPGRMPIGYSTATGKPVALPLKQYSTLALYFGDPNGKAPILKNMLFAAQREGMELWIIKQNEDSLFDLPDGIDPDSLTNADFLYNRKEDLKLLQQALTNEMIRRKGILQNYCTKHGLDEKQSDSFREAFPTLQSETAPILLLLENVSELCANLDRMGLMAYSNLLAVAAQRNIYVVGCFGRDIPKETSDNLVFSLFGKNDVILLGGRLDRQSFCRLPEEIRKPGALAYNSGVMQYRKKIYPLLIPCGKIEVDQTDEDLASIF